MKVYKAFKKVFDLSELQEGAIATLRKVYGGTHRTMTNLPVEAILKSSAADGIKKGLRTYWGDTTGASVLFIYMLSVYE